MVSGAGTAHFDVTSGWADWFFRYYRDVMVAVVCSEMIRPAEAMLRDEFLFACRDRATAAHATSCEGEHGNTEFFSQVFGGCGFAHNDRLCEVTVRVYQKDLSWRNAES